MENPHAPRVFEEGRRVNLLEVCIWILGLSGSLKISFMVLYGLYRVFGLLVLGLKGFRFIGLKVLGLGFGEIMG